MAEKYKVKFDEQLLEHIKTFRYHHAKPLLNKELVNAFDDYGTLLHYAAKCDNHRIARHLISMGSGVDALGKDDRTPLMLTVEYAHVKTAETLLEANADINIVNANGISALQMVFDSEIIKKLNSSFVSTKNMVTLYHLFLKKVKIETITTERFVAKLTDAGCTPYRAAKFKDFKFVKSMITCGIDVNSRDDQGKTALHASVELKDLKLAKWLIAKGANLNVQDNDGRVALWYAASRAHKAMLRLLLERGADPNIHAFEREDTPLFIAHMLLQDTPNEDACIELLLEYGAIPRNRIPGLYEFSIFSHAFYSTNRNRVDNLIAQLVIFDGSEPPVEKFETLGSIALNMDKFEKLVSAYLLCRQALAISMFEGLSLHDLYKSEFRLRRCVRNEAFVSEIQDVCSEYELSEWYPHYFKLLWKFIERASRAVRLEDEAIPVISRMFKEKCNSCYYSARKIAGYLHDRDLENLLNA